MKRDLLIELFKCGVDLFYKDFLDQKLYYLLKRKNYGGSLPLFLMFPLHAVVCMIKTSVWLE